MPLTPPPGGSARPPNMAGGTPPRAQASRAGLSGPVELAPAAEPSTRLDPTSVALIVEDRLCVSCGYNLKGLKAIGKCPECGRPIRRSAKRTLSSEGMVDAPIPWLKRMALGATLLPVGYGAIVVLFIAKAFDASVLSPLLIIAAGFLWCAGVWITTQTRPVLPSTSVNPALEWSRLRLAARLLSPSWVIMGAIAAVYRTVAPTGGTVLDVVLQSAGVALVLAGAASFAVWSAYASRIADWATDTNLGQSLRSTCVLTAMVAGLSAMLLLIPAGGIPYFIFALGGIGIFLSSVAYIGFRMLQFASMANWCLYNHVTADERDERLREKAVRAALEAQRHATEKALEAAKAGKPLPVTRKDAPIPVDGLELAPVSEEPASRAKPVIKPSTSNVAASQSRSRLGGTPEEPKRAQPDLF